MATALPLLAFIDGLGAPEMGLIFVLILVLFGGQKLPEFARGLGKSIREFKKAASGVEEEFKRALEEDERQRNAPPTIMPAEKPALPPAAETPPITVEASVTPVAGVTPPAAMPTEAAPTPPLTGAISPIEAATAVESIPTASPLPAKAEPPAGGSGKPPASS